MTPEQYRLALCIIIPALMILCVIIWQFYCDERNRRKFYEDRYYKEPRIHHYPIKKKPWLIRIFFLLMIFSVIGCEKETVEIKRCYTCQVTHSGVKKSVDICVSDPSEISFTSDAGIGLPWVCIEKK